MIKAGITTFHDSDNMGAVLQAYALQSVLESLGAQSVFLDVSAKKPQKPAPQPSTPMLRRLLAAEERRHGNFEVFRRSYLKRAEFTPEQAGDFDLFITGSDQVWNPDIIGENNAYLLSFAPPEKRCSYAASFGTAALPAQAEARFASELSQFRHLSVREQSGAALVKRLTGRQAAVDLDPTFLPEPAVWERLMDEKEDRPPYALLIMVRSDPTLLRSAQELARRRGLSLRIVTGGFFPMVGFEPWCGITVPLWLRLVHDADAVITSSFHGLAFSLIFRREFYTAPLVAELAERNTRIEELLSLFGCESRVLGSAEALPDWDDIDCRLAQARALSVKRLARLLAEYKRGDGLER